MDLASAVRGSGACFKMKQMEDDVMRRAGPRYVTTSVVTSTIQKIVQRLSEHTRLVGKQAQGAPAQMSGQAYWRLYGGCERALDSARLGAMHVRECRLHKLKDGLKRDINRLVLA